MFKIVNVTKWASYDLVKHKNSINNVPPISTNDSNNTNRPLRHPKLSATCYCSRKPGYYFFNAYLLIFLITITALTVFAMDCKLPQSRILTTYIILLTSVSFKWVINRFLPTVSYLTSLDIYSIVNIFFVCLLAVWHASIGSGLINSVNPERADFFMFFVFCGILFLINLIFLAWLAFIYTRISSLKKLEIEFCKKYLENLKTANIRF